MSGIMGPIEAGIVERYAGARARMGMVAARPPRVPRALVAPPRRALFTQAIEEVVPRCVNLLTPPSWKTIAQLVAMKHGLTLDDLVGPSRQRPISNARAEAIRLVDAHIVMSLPAIGRRFNRDHTTILHAIRKGGGKERGGKAETVWTPEMETRVRRMWRANATYKEIAEGVNVSIGALWTWLRKNRVPCRNGKPRIGHVAFAGERSR